MGVIQDLKRKWAVKAYTDLTEVRDAIKTAVAAGDTAKIYVDRYPEAAPDKLPERVCVAIFKGERGNHGPDPKALYKLGSVDEMDRLKAMFAGAHAGIVVEQTQAASIDEVKEYEQGELVYQRPLKSLEVSRFRAA